MNRKCSRKWYLFSISFTDILFILTRAQYSDYDRGWMTEEPGFGSWKEIFSFPKHITLAVGLTQPCIHWIFRAVSLKVELSWCGVWLIIESNVNFCAHQIDQ